MKNTSTTTPSKALLESEKTLARTDAFDAAGAAILGLIDHERQTQEVRRAILDAHRAVMKAWAEMRGEEF